jgi:hypothetical protein
MAGSRGGKPSPASPGKQTGNAANAQADFGLRVFINCPFDDDYRELFRALVFAICDAGFDPRCAKEADDSGEVRVEKIASIIKSCRFGVHDISRTDLDAANKLPRFNMPYELGLDQGAKRYGNAQLRTKILLVLDVDRFRYQKFISDIAGQDLRAHAGQPAKAVAALRAWLTTSGAVKGVPGEKEIEKRRLLFEKQFPKLCKSLGVDADSVTFVELKEMIVEFLKNQPGRAVRGSA